MPPSPSLVDARGVGPEASTANLNEHSFLASRTNRGTGADVTGAKDEGNKALDDLESRWKRLDAKVRSSLRSVDLVQSPRSSPVGLGIRDAWTLRALGASTDRNVNLNETPEGDDEVEHMVVGARALKADVLDLARKREELREELFGVSEQLRRERLALASAKRTRATLDAETAKAKAEMDAASESMNMLLNGIIEKEADVEARFDAMGDLEQLISRVEREANDLDDRLEEVLEREVAATAAGKALGQREGEISRREEELSQREEEFVLREERLEGIEARELAVSRREQSAADQEARITARSRELDEEKQRIQCIYEQAMRLDSRASGMMHDLDRAKMEVTARENRVVESEDKLAALQDTLSARNMELIQLLEAASLREADANAAQRDASESMVRARELEKEALAWKRRAAEAEDVLKDKEIVSRHMRALKEFSEALNEREYKLRQCWDSCAAQAASLVDVNNSSLRYVVSSEATECLRRDAKLAENVSAMSSTSPTTAAQLPCATCARHETRLQRWAVHLALESSSLKARTDSIVHRESQFNREIAEAKENRTAAESLMSEIQAKEIELECAIPALEAREKSLVSRAAILEEKERDIEKGLEKVNGHARELANRERALKSLELRWEDRVADVSSREQVVSDQHHRISQQRESLENREANLLEQEEKLRIELVDLAARRSQLRSIEDRLRQRTAEVAERELDADTLLSEARKEMGLIREFERDLEQKFERLGNIAMEMEDREHRITASGGDLLAI